MKTRQTIYLLVAVLFIMIFFFDVIAVPVENIQGAGNQNEFIYGGIYWTSLSYELSVGDYLGALGITSMFLIPIIGIKFMKFEDD